jgi:hypothetical protein
MLGRPPFVAVPSRLTEPLDLTGSRIREAHEMAGGPATAVFLVTGVL